MPARVESDSPKKAGKRKEAIFFEKNQKTFTYQGQHLICP
jgi:hypothetical protein